LIRKVLTAMLVLLSGSALAEELPLNPDVSKATLATTICHPGWTRTIRPYVSTMKQIKAGMLAAAGVRSIRPICELLICPGCGGREVVASEKSQTGGSLLH
jgi:hypothetical protein